MKPIDWKSPDVRNAAILLAVAIALWLPRLKGPIDLRYDGGVYYILGTSIAQAEGYRLLNEPGNLQAVQYPPLLPAVVAAHQWALRTDDPAVVGQALRITFFVLFIAYALLVYAMARQFLSPIYSLLVGLLTILSFRTFFQSDLLFGEIPFALCSAAFVIFNRKAGEKPRYFVCTSLLGIAAYLLRTAGIALLIAWILESAIRRNWKQLGLRAAVAIVPIIAWNGYIYSVTSGEEYQNPPYEYARAQYMYYNVTYGRNMSLIDPFRPELGEIAMGQRISRMLDHARAVPVSVGEGVTTGRGFAKLLARNAQHRARLVKQDGSVLVDPSIVNWLIGIAGAFTLAGLVVLLVKREWFVVLYIGGSIGLIFLTPWPQQFERYLSPLTPFLALALVMFLTCANDYLHEKLPGRWKATGTMLVLLVVGMIFCLKLGNALQAMKNRHEKGHTYVNGKGSVGDRLFYYDEAWSDLDRSIEWIAARAQPGDIVATSAPHWVYLKTGLKSVMVPMVDDAKEHLRLLAEVPVRWVIVDELSFSNMTQRYTLPAMKSDPVQWRPAFTGPAGKVTVYERSATGGVVQN